MSTFIDFKALTEAKVEDGATPKLAVFTFGRFNPPTKGHLRLVSAVLSLAEEKGGEALIFPSQTVDKPLKKTGKVGPERSKNPLNWDEKIQFMRKVFPQPQTIIKAAAVRTPHEVLTYLDERKFTDLIFVVGSDRVQEFKTRWLPYAKESFRSAEVVSAGSRDADSEGISGMSSSKAREAAQTGDDAKFAVATGWTGPLARQLMNVVRERMGIE